MCHFQWVTFLFSNGTEPVKNTLIYVKVQFSADIYFTEFISPNAEVIFGDDT